MDAARTQMIRVRVTEVERDQIKARAEAVHRTVSDYMRLAALGEIPSGN